VFQTETRVVADDVYYLSIVVVTDVSDVSTDEGVCLRVVMTLLTRIDVSLAR